jgi:hypothetical protein
VAPCGASCRTVGRDPGLDSARTRVMSPGVEPGVEPGVGRDFDPGLERACWTREIWTRALTKGPGRGSMAPACVAP